MNDVGQDHPLLHPGLLHHWHHQLRVFQRQVGEEVGTLSDLVWGPVATDQPPGPEKVLVEILQLFQVLSGEPSQVDKLWVILEPLEVVEEGMSQMASCRMLLALYRSL